MLWESREADVVKAKELLRSGRVDLLGLTYYYPGKGSDLSDYRKWVDLALKYNARTRFVIQSPWARYNNSSFAAYEAAVEEGLKNVHRLIDQLRAAYPGTSFYCIPQGRWMVGLWRLYNRGELPEISAVQEAPPLTTCLFIDKLGHGGKIPVEMGALLWLAVIYQVDLNQYGWETNTRADLKKLAQDICRSDPYCGLKSNPPNKPGAGDRK